MKIQHTILASLVVMLLTTSAVWADKGKGNRGPKFDVPKKFKNYEGPEISAATATVPLALLSGIVLLMKERSRSRRPSKPE